MRRAFSSGVGLTVLLSALCCGLAGLIVLELAPPIADPAARAAVRRATKAVDPAAEPRFAFPPMRAFAEVLARPVFSETRHPPSPEAAGTSTSAPFVLVGVVLSGSERRALIEHGQPAHLDRAAEGQELDGWTLEAIHLDRVVLRRGETRLEVKAKDKALPVQQRRVNTGSLPAAPVPARPPSVAGFLGLPAPSGDAGQQ